MAKPRFSKPTLELAAQVVFEYPEWGDEHIQEMLATYRACGDKPPCTADQLEDACKLLQKQKDAGLNFQEAIDAAAK